MYFMLGIFNKGFEDFFYLYLRNIILYVREDYIFNLIFIFLKLYLINCDVFERVNV